MIYLNIQRVMRLRGVDNHYKELLAMGFAPMTARRLLDSSIGRLGFEHLEKLCLALNCTPNDLLEWQPPKNLTNYEQQAITKLKRGGAEDVSKILTSLPMEKLEQIAGMMQDLKDE